MTWPNAPYSTSIVNEYDDWANAGVKSSIGEEHGGYVPRDIESPTSLPPVHAPF